MNHCLPPHIRSPMLYKFRILFPLIKRRIARSLKWMTNLWNVIGSYDSANQHACLPCDKSSFLFVSSPLYVSTASSVICHIACTIQQSREKKTPTMTNLNVCDESMKWQTQEKEEEKRVVNTMGFVFVLRYIFVLYISNTMGNETTNKICLFNVTQTCEHTKIKYDKPKSVSA